MIALVASGEAVSMLPLESGETESVARSESKVPMLPLIIDDKKELVNFKNISSRNKLC